ncbi:hypothetical protein GCM10011342_20550 [Aquisalinus flavus]|uniref:Transposase DDE domain-containing protein n=1 Tax=Aquisalinus flavus TaxID=1526572 RepID=A0A8J2V5G6_9PROT|nr:hypothetical protein FF099_10355 [Aquisalinus flavus]GGD11620.1 hypothetical protein GCM10011342_20550 [Aquisalinus flavus]
MLFEFQILSLEIALCSVHRETSYSPNSGHFDRASLVLVRRFRNNGNSKKKRSSFRGAGHRLKDFGRIATRYDILARNFLAAVQFTATKCYSLRVLALGKSDDKTS